ncbi:MAG: SGNH/GDSL hydrolase family protein [Roseibacillus sp.]|nr:SGNH/GDSL hydrolase family protein [Roseibacillus sp.]
MVRLCRAVLLLGLTGTSLGQAQDTGKPDPTFELRDGDRVVFLGNSFFERARQHGYLETSLALRWPGRKVTFRNLGWDGDTVFGHSRTGGRRRSVFGNPEEGFGKLIAHLRQLDPTVVFVAYGWNESFAGIQGAPDFRKGLERLLTEAGNRRFVLLSPTPAERGFGAELPFRKAGQKAGPDYVSQRNAVLKFYRDAVASVAGKGGHHFVDLFSTLQQGKEPYSSNGIHPGTTGYRRIARIMAQRLHLPEPVVALGSKEAESLRHAIVKKNTLYFHRWRPRNDAFVYGERKNEQAIAQTEPAKFEPFVTTQETAIRKQLEALK